MAGPFGIEQVDVPGILGVYQGAQDRRVNQMLMQRKMALEDRQIAQQEQISNVYRNLRDPSQQSKGGGQSAPAGGMASAYAQPAQPPASVDANMPVGSPLSPATINRADATGTVAAPPQAAPQAPTASWMDANKDLVQQLMTVAPQQAFDLMKQLHSMDEEQIAKVEKFAATMAKVGEHLSSFPDGPARQAEIRRITPDLVAEGIPPEKIAATDTSDKGLQWLQVHGMDLDKIIARQKDERTYAETARRNRATEANATADTAVRQGALGLARQREGRVAKGSPNAAPTGMSDEALLNALSVR